MTLRNGLTKLLNYAELALLADNLASSDPAKPQIAMQETSDEALDKLCDSVLAGLASMRSDRSSASGNS